MLNDLLLKRIDSLNAKKALVRRMGKEEMELAYRIHDLIQTQSKYNAEIDAEEQAIAEERRRMNPKTFFARIFSR